MMESLHPNRTNLLRLKEKRKNIARSMNILKARRQALIVEFLSSAHPFLEKRKKIMVLYGQGRQNLAVSRGMEGAPFLSALAAVNQHDPGIAIEVRNVMGAKYKTARLLESIKRPVAEREYDFLPTTPHLEESFFLFEQVVEQMLDIAGDESKLKNLGREIQKTTRKFRVLEERILPELAGHIRKMSQYIGEREREEYFRLKRFKDMR